MMSMRELVLDFYARMDAVAKEAIDSGRLRLACEGAGCNLCCYERVDLFPVETQLLHDTVAALPDSIRSQIRRNLARYKAAVPVNLRTNDFLLKGIRQTPEHIKKISPTAFRKLEKRGVKAGRMYLRESMKGQAPCPLLVNGACSVYEFRPMSCRGWFSTNKDECGNTDRKTPSIHRIDQTPFYGVIVSMGLPIFPVVPLIEALECISIANGTSLDAILSPPLSFPGEAK